MVDWSGGNDRGAAPVKDAIWVCEAGAEPLYMRNRQVAEAWLVDRIERALGAGERLALGFDFPFGYPSGFAKALCGGDTLALWDWLEARIEDAPEANNRFDLAGEINARFEGVGPFWGNGLKRDIEALPRKGLTRTCDVFAERREVETQAKGAFPVWQLAGAGAVGSQVLMGLPVLARLRRRFAGHVAAWPMETLDAPVALIEIWPSLLASEVAAQQREGEIKDAAQVRVVAEAVAALNAGGQLGPMLEVEEPKVREEGWILGVGHEAVLRGAAAVRPNRLPSNCFALPPGVDWTPVDVALQNLRAALSTVVGTETVSVEGAGGRVLADEVRAKRSNPPVANSAVDGFGLWLDAPMGERLVVPLEEDRAAAGDPFEGAVPEGHAARVLTGAALPEGVNTVVLQEDAEIGDGVVTLFGPVKVGANTRQAGEDVSAGDVVLAAGRRLRAQDVGLLAAVGVSEVVVWKPLKVAVISTGDELLAPGEAAAPHQTYDANGPMLSEMVCGWGHELALFERVGDDRDAVRACLNRAASCDAILTSGGASSGAEDHLAAILQEEGVVQNWRIALKPGRPLALGQWQGVPLFGLPGNPVAAFVTAAIFARPALAALAGEDWPETRGVMVPAAFSKSKKNGRREFLRARLTKEGHAEVFASEGSGRISGLSWATGLVDLPHEGVDIREGDLVRFLPFSEMGL